LRERRGKTLAVRIWGVTILGDDLYCKQALCEAFIREGLNFILVCKPDPHKTLTEWVAGLAVTGDVQTLAVKRRQGKYRYTDTYRFVNQVPVRDGEGALDVNWCELTTTRDDGKVVYKNAFATNHRITEANVADISTRRARALEGGERKQQHPENQGLPPDPLLRPR
jgi:hypothetical protein